MLILAVVPWWTGRPFGGKVSDREDRVSIVLPSGWIDATSDDAGQVVTYDDSGDETDPHRVPDLEAMAWNSETAVPGGQYVTIEILPAHDESLNRLHAQHTAAECADDVRCNRPRRADRVMLDGRPAVSQFLTSGEYSTTVWAVTVLDGKSVIRFTGTSRDWDDAGDGGQLANVLRTFRIHP